MRKRRPKSSYWRHPLVFQSTLSSEVNHSIDLPPRNVNRILIAFRDEMRWRSDGYNLTYFITLDAYNSGATEEREHALKVLTRLNNRGKVGL